MLGHFGCGHRFNCNKSISCTVDNMGDMQVEGQGAVKSNTQVLKAMLSGQGLALNADGWHISLDCAIV